jgi:hypothetical protein
MEASSYMHHVPSPPKVGCSNEPKMHMLRCSMSGPALCTPAIICCFISRNGYHVHAAYGHTIGAPW